MNSNQLKHIETVRKMAFSLFKEQTTMPFLDAISKYKNKPKLNFEFNDELAEQFCNKAESNLSHFLYILDKNKINYDVLNNSFISAWLYNNIVESTVLIYIGDLSSKLNEKLLDYMVLNLNEFINSKSHLKTIIELINEFGLNLMKNPSWDKNVIDETLDSNDNASLILNLRNNLLDNVKILPIYENKPICVYQIKEFINDNIESKENWNKLVARVMSALKGHANLEQVENYIIQKILY